SDALSRARLQQGQVSRPVEHHRGAVPDRPRPGGRRHPAGGRTRAGHDLRAVRRGADRCPRGHHARQLPGHPDAGPAAATDLVTDRMAQGLVLSLPAVAVMPAAAWVSSISPPGPLYIVVALLVLASLVISVALVRVHTTVDGRAAQVITGIGSGLGTVLGGVGGPAVTVYAVLSRWPVLPMV